MSILDWPALKKMNMMIHARDNVLSCSCLILRLERIQQSHSSQKINLLAKLVMRSYKISRLLWLPNNACKQQNSKSHSRCKKKFIILDTVLPITKVGVQQLFLPTSILMKRSWRKGCCIQPWRVLPQHHQQHNMRWCGRWSLLHLYVLFHSGHGLFWLACFLTNGGFLT